MNKRTSANGHILSIAMRNIIIELEEPVRGDHLRNDLV